jgi:UDP-N-acetylmuramoyl-tripeptide--D-alanyl-D-alanine ligase
MDIFVPKFIQYQLYLLQLENYELGRYWKLLFKKGPFPRKKYPERKELVWSVKAKALMLMAWALHALVIIAAGLIVLSVKPGTDNFFTAIIFAVLIFLPFYFIFFSVALLALAPLDGVAKNRLAAKAKSKINNLESKIKIIGIAGSYGKTTMKEVLHQVLGARFKVLATPESVNTPVGISRWILNKVNEGTDIIIVEMGEHYENDIKEICEIAKPDIAVVTGVNESHLERMKNMDTVTSTIFEIVSNSKQGAAVVLNADDARVMENYKKFVWPDHKVIKFQVESFKSKQFNAEKLCWEAEADGIGKIEVSLLGEYSLGDIDAAIKIGKSLGMSGEEIKKGIAKIKPVEHRLQPMPSAANVLVIDDSYNGNPDGAKEAIKVLSRFEGRRKIYITPGLVEMGKSSAEVHRGIGKQLAGVADVVILVKNSVTGFIEEGIKSAVIARSQTAKQSNREEKIAAPSAALGLAMTQVVWFNTVLEAHAALKNILKPGDVILFQNDWGDQYI